MKLTLLSLLLAGAGAGWFGLRTDGTPAPSPCSGAACTMEVECIDPDTCLVTCYDENGAVVCQEEVTCDEPCTATSEAGCGAETAEAPACAPSEGCGPAAGCAPSTSCAPLVAQTP
jgi:hypothetical protein